MNAGTKTRHLSDPKHTKLRVWAIVPIKCLNHAKIRLASVLGNCREEFAFQLACRTLRVLRTSRAFAGVIVVTSDPRVAAVARANGAMVIDDESKSLNDACSLGIQSAAGCLADVGVLLPSDLAILTTRSLIEALSSYTALRERHGRSPIGLVCCKEGTGTNMVMLNPQRYFSPSFGPDSFAKHRQNAAHQVFELRAPEVSFDIDWPADLQKLIEMVAESQEDNPLFNLVRRLR